MSKLRRLMNRLSYGALTSVAALALTVTATNMNRCCWFRGLCKKRMQNCTNMG
ncbi:hypothetical protein [Agathobacter sp.]